MYQVSVVSFNPYYKQVIGKSHFNRCVLCVSHRVSAIFGWSRNLWFISCLDGCQPTDIVTEWFGDCWGVPPPCSNWVKPNDSYWIVPSLCIVDSPLAVSIDASSTPSNSVSSFSSLPEECCPATSPTIKSSFFFQDNEGSKWHFPNKLPPVPLPGWKPLP